MKTKKRLVFFITHSLGELDVVLPIICKIGLYKYEFYIVFLVRSIYEKFGSSLFYKKVFGLLGVDYAYIKLPNKFDNNVGNTLISRLGRRLRLSIISPVALFNICAQIYRSSVIFHEFSCQVNSVRVLYRISWLLQKDVFTYIHGHACQIDTKLKKIRYCPMRSRLLNFHQHSASTYYAAGYTKQSIIGYPKFYKEWIDFISKNFHENLFGEEYVLIFTRPISPYYMDANTYSEILFESIASIKECYGRDILIVIKLHPREDPEYVKTVLFNSEMRIVVSQVDSSVLSLNACVAISFWTSAILSSLAFNVPSVEFYKESRKFRYIEPEGSVYKKLGIPSVDTKQNLLNFLSKNKNKRLGIPAEILNNFRTNSDVNFDSILSKRL